MATKNKEARKSFVAATTELQEAINSVGNAQSQIASSISFAEEAASNLRAATARLVAQASRLRRVPKRTYPSTTTDGGLPPQKGTGKVPAGRKHMASSVPTSPRRNRKASKVGVRKRLPRKPSGKEFFHGQQLPH